MVDIRGPVVEGYHCLTPQHNSPSFPQSCSLACVSCHLAHPTLGLDLTGTAPSRLKFDPSLCQLIGSIPRYPWQGSVKPTLLSHNILSAVALSESPEDEAKPRCISKNPLVQSRVLQSES